MCPPGQTTSFEAECLRGELVQGLRVTSFASASEGAAELSVCTCDGFYYQQQCIKCAFGTRFEAGSCAPWLAVAMLRCERAVVGNDGARLASMSIMYSFHTNRDRQTDRPAGGRAGRQAARQTDRRRDTDRLCGRRKTQRQTDRALSYAVLCNMGDRSAVRQPHSLR